MIRVIVKPINLAKLEVIVSGCRMVGMITHYLMSNAECPMETLM